MANDCINFDDVNALSKLVHASNLVGNDFLACVRANSRLNEISLIGKRSILLADVTVVRSAVRLGGN
jgi:hypothetical protein